MKKSELCYTQDTVDKHICDWIPNSRFKDLTGAIRGDFKVLKLYGKFSNHTWWFCRCSCGNIVLRSTNRLNSKSAKYCCFCSRDRLVKKYIDTPKMDIRERMLYIHRNLPHVDLVSNLTRRWTFYCGKCKTFFRDAQSEMIRSTYKGTPCRCDNGVKFTQWSQYLREEQIRDKCKLVDAEFSGWASEYGYENNVSRLRLKCVKNTEHLEWDVSVNNFIGNEMYGCPSCANENKGQGLRHTLEEFISEGTKVHKGKYTYEDYEYINSRTPSKIFCTKCNKHFTSSYDNHINKKRNCPHCSNKSQTEAYIIVIKDSLTPVAVKYGIANNTDIRFYEHQRDSAYDLSLLGIWDFEESYNCKYAEHEVKREVKGSVLTSEEFKCNTETTYASNIDKIIQIYEDFGGTRRSLKDE